MVLLLLLEIAFCLFEDPNNEGIDPLSGTSEVFLKLVDIPDTLHPPNCNVLPGDQDMWVLV